ncbi:TetR family transcriptional regulator [Sphingorhabdus sp. EL138]|nr:TetR family transcriptional regulator [Sphingorhabdus sp. EL138]
MTIKDQVIALKRERIVEAAAQLFYDRGYDRTTLEAVADHWV